MAFQEYSHSKSLPDMEQGILEFWKKNKIFEKAVEQNKDGKPFVFFEGPPTANGKPGIHHVLSRVYKDIYIRYYSQKGYYVPRRAGWDCHGLPVEREVEKKLGIKTKAEIEQTVGLGEFNRLCRESVMTYIGDWNRFTERMGFWIDMDDAYYTLHNEFIESVWSLLKTIWDKGLIYQGYKVVQYDPVMGATLSDHEIADSYKTVKDPSITVRFKILVDDFGADASFLVWTTTPWTLPSNTAVALSPDAEYVVVERVRGEGEPDAGKTERLVLAEALREKVLGPAETENDEGEKTTAYTVIRTMPGKELLGTPYERIIDWVDFDETKNAHYALAGEFVTMDTGTGIVHIAPAYGADDLEVGNQNDLPVIHAVGLDGKFIKGTPLAGEFFKDADKSIVKMLRERGMVWKYEQYEHEYPFGPRTGAPILYYAKDGWYIRTTQLRKELIKNNNTINWTPEHIKQGRFGNWLENNRDWALSRERYWGTPLPVWTDGEGDFRIIGSVAELERLTGRKLTDLDLHRPHVDEIEFEENGRKFRRVPEVIDCWFDSGAMPYAQWGYPIRGGAQFDHAYPADFITEAIDQTRGWFYTLLAVSTMVTGDAPYKNVICLGHVVDEKGEKMSKSKGNTVDPYNVFNNHGADAVRWYFLTGAPPGNSRRIKDPLKKDKPGEKFYDDPVKPVLGFMRTLLNSVGFFTMYAAVDGIKIESDWENAPIKGAPDFASRPPIDRWVLSYLQKLVGDVTESLDKYDSYAAGKAMEEFTDLLSNWYIRRNRRRFWKGEPDGDKLAAYDTLYRCLTTLARLMAPLTPFVSEDVFHALVTNAAAGSPASVHLAGWPMADLKNWYDAGALREGDVLQRTASLGHAARNQSGVKVRQPLSRLMVYLQEPEDRDAIRGNEAVLTDELNVKAIEYLDDSAGILDYRAKPNLPRLGKRLGKLMRHVQAWFRDNSGREIAAKVKAGEKLIIEAEGESVELEPEDVLLESVSREGSSAVESGGILVALDTNITEELKREGRVRDLVRNVQELRKNSGLEVTDRITLDVKGETSMDEAVQAFTDYIQDETLAVLGKETGPASGEIQATIDGELVLLRIWKRTPTGNSASGVKAKEPAVKEKTAKKSAAAKEKTPAAKKKAPAAKKKTAKKKPVAKKKAAKKKSVPKKKAVKKKPAAKKKTAKKAPAKKKPVAKKATKKKVVKKTAKKATQKKVVKKAVKKNVKKKKVVKKSPKKKPATKNKTAKKKITKKKPRR